MIDPNRPIEVMVPNSILHPYQVMHSPYDGKIYVITDNDDTYTTQTIRINSSEEPISKKVNKNRIILRFTQISNTIIIILLCRFIYREMTKEEQLTMKLKEDEEIK